MLLRTADITAAMSVEALLGTDAVFAADLQALRPHPGQAASAANLRALLADSAIVASHRHPGTAPACRTPTRCAARRRCTAPSATRSRTPRLVRTASSPPPSTTRSSLPDGRVESNGNFHGAPVGYVLDFLAIAAADLASIAERRTDRFLDVARNHGLPPFLADDPGVDSGYMIAQYTAGRSRLGAEAAGRAGVASTRSRRRRMQEDHVSMGWSAARKLRRAVDGLTQVLAIEILTAARALDLRRAAAARARRRPPSATPLRGSVAGPARTATSARRSTPPWSSSRPGGVAAAAESVIGPLHDAST